MRTRKPLRCNYFSKSNWKKTKEEEEEEGENDKANVPHRTAECAKQ